MTATPAKSAPARPWAFRYAGSIAMPNRAAACAHWCLRCSVGVTMVSAATSRRASSSAATVSAYVVLPAPGVATSRKSRRGVRKYSW